MTRPLAIAVAVFGFGLIGLYTVSPAGAGDAAQLRAIGVECGGTQD
jgi:hypothetical protein